MAEMFSQAFAGLPASRPEEIGLSRSALKQLVAAMERDIAAGRAPGASMLIARHGKVGFAQRLGLLRPEGPPMPEDAIFRIYSMTKPVVSVAAMTLVEDGGLLITDPLSKYIPAFSEMKVGVENGDKLDLVPAKRAITIQDLMRHTSGLTYGFTGNSRVQKLVFAQSMMSQTKTSAEHIEALAALRGGGRRAFVDDWRLRALRRDAQQRRRPQRRAHSRAAHDRLHGERPSCAGRGQGPRAAMARPRLRARLLRAHRRRPRPFGG